MLDETAARAAYFPLTNPPGKSERLYSLRSVSLTVELTFFIEFPFGVCARTSTDKFDRIFRVCVGNRKESALF